LLTSVSALITKTIKIEGAAFPKAAPFGYLKTWFPVTLPAPFLGKGALSGVEPSFPR
jgi:hypothetical protein